MPDPHDAVYAQIKKDLGEAVGKPTEAPPLRAYVVEGADPQTTEYFKSDFGQFVMGLIEGPPRIVASKEEFRGTGIVGAYTGPQQEGEAVMGPTESIVLNPDPFFESELEAATTHEMGHAFTSRFGIEGTFDRSREWQRQDLARQARLADVELTEDAKYRQTVEDLIEGGTHWATAYSVAGPGWEYSADVFRRAADYLWATRERTPEQFAAGLELLGEQQPGIVGMIDILREERSPIFEAMGHPIMGEKEPGFLTRVVRTVGDIVRQRGPQYEPGRFDSPKEHAAHEQWEEKTRAWRERRDLIGEAMRSKGGK